MQRKYKGIILRENVEQNDGRIFTPEALKANDGNQGSVSINFNANQVVGTTVVSYKEGVGLESEIIITDEELFIRVFGESLWPTSVGMLGSTEKDKIFNFTGIGLCSIKNVDLEIKQLKEWDYESKKDRL